MTLYTSCVLLHFHHRKVDLDQDRIKLFALMTKANLTNADYINNTSTYYDPLSLPAAPVYCTKFSDTLG